MTSTHAPAAVGYEDIVIPQGATWTLGWVYGEGDPLAFPDGWPDFWTGRAKVRWSWTAADALASFHSSDEADGTVVLDTNDDGLAVVTLSLTPDASGDWTWTQGVYDVELDNGSGRVIRLVEGVAQLSLQVTR